MRINKIINIAASCALLLTSCVESENPHGTHGYLDLSVTHDESLQIVPVTKADEEPQAIRLDIYDSEGAMVMQWDDVAQITEPVVLPTGKYTATAAMGEDAGPACFDAPHYTGTSEFSIRPGVITTTDIVCKLSSVKVTANMSADIIENFEYSLTVSNGAGELVFDENTVGSEGYFSVTSSISWTLELKNADNEKFVFQDSYADVKAAQHYSLTFSIAQEDESGEGAADFRIIVDDSLNEPKIHDVVIIIDKAAPTVSGPDVIARYMADKSQDTQVGLSSGVPFTAIFLMHDDAALTAAGVPAMSDLMSISDFSELEQAGINVQADQDSMTFDFAALADRLPIGKYTLTLLSSNTTGKEVEKVITINVLSSMGALTIDPWAKFMHFKGTWLSQNTPAGLSVQYRRSGESQWSNADATYVTVNEADRKVAGFICGLNPSASYEVRLASVDESGASVSASTEAAPQLYNLSFDDWCSIDGVAYPYASGANPTVWDTANGGTKSMSVYPTGQEKSDVISGSAVRMESTYASMLGIGKFAAGNIYTGVFREVQLSPMGAILDWGVAFNGRPLGLKGYYKYAPVAIDYVGSGYEHLKGQSDICQIQAALMNWSAPFEVNTGKNQFVDFSKSNKTMLAHSELVAGTTNGKWTQFTIYMGYRNITTRPTYTIVSACASRYGDYFTGGKGSVMYVDQFEFVYDPMELSETDRAAFFALFK